MIGNPHRHYWGNPQGLVKSAQIEVRNEQPDSGYMIFEFLREAVR
jgi:hypothetical protein